MRAYSVFPKDKFQKSERSKLKCGELKAERDDFKETRKCKMMAPRILEICERGHFL